MNWRLKKEHNGSTRQKSDSEKISKIDKSLNKLTKRRKEKT
jgi:hypothetical protein